MLSLTLVLLLILVPNFGLAVPVQTLSGEVNGFSVQVPQQNAPIVEKLGKASTVDIFLGVPYAKPPVGNLRFAPTVPVSPWKSLNATKFKSPCHQNINYLKEYYKTDITVNDLSEDCLHLNIFSPKFANASKDTKLPVMVWLHGGAYKHDTSNSQDGRVLATYGVVVVSIEYRLGVMGYLSTNTPDAPGNVGMLDQIEALRWIKKNIQFFGGDPNKVTIFGQSSGGSTVSMHMLSPLTKGLFHGVIAQSGSATAHFSMYRPPYSLLNTTMDLAKNVGCPTNTTSMMLQCLRIRSAQQLVNARVSHPPMSSAWVPQVDGYYIKDLPMNLLTKGLVHRVPMIIGSVSCETCGDYTYIPGIENGLSRAQVENEFKGHSARYGEKKDEIFQALMCQFYPRDGDAIGKRDRLFRFMDYYEYISGMYLLADKYSELNPDIWVYKYNYRSTTDSTPSYWGVYHAMELQYEFGDPFLKDFGYPYDTNFKTYRPNSFNWTVDDRQHSQNLMKLWSDFARNLNADISGTKWPRYDTKQKSYLQIDKVNSIQHNQSPLDLEFWNDFVPKVLKGTANPSDCPLKMHTGIIGR